jgi:hypothetical protein
MQVSGRVIILSAFALAIAMSGGAWWYHYTQVRQAAAFWGSPGGRLLVRGPEVIFYELGDPSEEANPAGAETIAGRPVISSTDLSGKQGLVHLRHALYQDSNFQWEGRVREPTGAADDWAYAVRFGDGEQTMTALLSRDLGRVGKVEGDKVDAAPAPRIAGPVRRYLSDVGALKSDQSSADPAASTEAQEAAGR